MKKLLLLLLFSTIGCTNTKHVLVIGDSITAHTNNGYAQQLSDILYLHEKPNYIFHVYGYSGEGTTFIRKKFESIDLKPYSDIIILAGVNNIKDPDTVIFDLTKMYKKGLDEKKRVIALTLTPWKNYSTWTVQKQKNTELVNQSITNYIKLVVSAVDYKNYIPVDIYSALLTNSFDCVTVDGLHPNGIGNLIIASEIYRTVYK
jgi:hypothetical protein